ncbi:MULTISPECIES: 30S ribosome-binding factor RbfA [Carboxydocella]|uniref:Ribosome-binding factor A n=2 Tax=Carboxydocella TaxID=178898 RepID=A0A1T4P799_9FIRM|nr:MULTISPECIES: 30S ribosome-binding factor RbfA [Carboxydocella]AVX20719.1 ribosome-binding factor A [Carboxydocella thermautotrophica]AVX31138.1 ribosome-binding factor A [Carboxydocella thermautotrophica]SJZ87086.1 ribosome-binding factor A [Carboxydocella sporoproducens DSM 16521]GAW28248.1 ribosome-binding factor A [Carboxydocella sp. ULO1]GAW30719.1 ribosome-binding factor A [Carboxydocella sp. JDF658]
MGGHRPQRVAEEIKKELAKILREDVKEEVLRLVTVTAVNVSSDLRYVKIYFTLLGGKGDKGAVAELLEKSSGWLRGELGRRLRLRFAPELQFVYDESIEHGARIMELLNKVNQNEESRD